MSPEINSRERRVEYAQRHYLGCNGTPRRVAALCANVAAAASLLLAIPVAHGGHYELVEGKGVEVCEAYGKNLNSFGDPMVCERQINPRLSDFRKPNWAKPSPSQTRALEFHLAMLVSRALGRPEPKSEAEIKVRTEEDAGWPAKRRIARVDIDNDGTLETLLKQEDGTCPESRGFSVRIAVLTKDEKHYDLERSKYIDVEFDRLIAQLEKDQALGQRRTAGIARNEIQGGSLYDIFVYKNVSYFDLWQIGKDFPDPKSARLHVFLHKKGTTERICTYRFQQ